MQFIQQMSGFMKFMLIPEQQLLHILVSIHKIYYCSSFPVNCWEKNSAYCFCWLGWQIWSVASMWMSFQKYISPHSSVVNLLSGGNLNLIFQKRDSIASWFCQLSVSPAWIRSFLQGCLCSKRLEMCSHYLRVISAMGERYSVSFKSY